MCHVLSVSCCFDLLAKLFALDLQHVGSCVQGLICSCVWCTDLSTSQLHCEHFDVQESLLQFWTERHETWQEYGEA